MIDPELVGESIVDAQDLRALKPEWDRFLAVYAPLFGRE